MRSTDKAPWVKCTYRAEMGIVNGYGVSVDIGSGNIPWPVGCHNVRGEWVLNDMITGYCLCGFKRMPNVEAIMRAMPCFISRLEAQRKAEELDDMRLFCSPEIRAYKTLAPFQPDASNAIVRKLFLVRYLDSDFRCMGLRMGWHAMEE